MSHSYNEDFYKYIAEGSRYSANSILSMILSNLPIESVVDFGCGSGSWLAAARDLGVRNIQGIDGDYVTEDSLEIPNKNFRDADLSQPISLNRKFDLAISMEVAEHLPYHCSQEFISTLTRHADIILFSAAIPGQCGENHINEQPLEYWRNLLAEKGYDCFDCIYPTFSSNSSIKPWYRFNGLLYIKNQSNLAIPNAISRYKIESTQPIKRNYPISWQARLAMGRILPTSIKTIVAQSLSKVSKQ